MGRPSALLTTILALAGVPANAAADDGQIRADGPGSTSAHAWKPSFLRLEVDGGTLRPGLAVGLRGALRDQTGRTVVPALSMDLGPRSSVSLLHAGQRGTMIVFQVLR